MSSACRAAMTHLSLPATPPLPEATASIGCGGNGEVPHHDDTSAFYVNAIAMLLGEAHCKEMNCKTSDLATPPLPETTASIGGARAQLSKSGVTHRWTRRLR